MYVAHILQDVFGEFVKTYFPYVNMKDDVAVSPKLFGFYAFGNIVVFSSRNSIWCLESNLISFVSSVFVNAVRKSHQNT